jgi:hypothetical protein
MHEIVLKLKCLALSIDIEMDEELRENQIRKLIGYIYGVDDARKMNDE